MEDMVHTFDLMVADRYADDGVTTRFAPRHDKWSRPNRADGRELSRVESAVTAADGCRLGAIAQRFVRSRRSRRAFRGAAVVRRAAPAGR